MLFRIGIHLGDITTEGGRVYGDGVNIAARLEGLAEPGRICVSSTVHEQVRNKLELVYDDLGDQTIKNIPDQVHVYQVRLDGPADPTEPRRPAKAGTGRLGTALLATGAVVLLGSSFSGPPGQHPSGS